MHQRIQCWLQRHINSSEKAAAEEILKAKLIDGLNALSADQKVMFKLTLPEQAGFYKECIDRPNMARVVALSGGYSREESNDRLSKNNGMVASFSRALTEGPAAQQSQAEFDKMLDESIQSIFDASRT